jgi:hypothetical protein
MKLDIQQEAVWWEIGTRTWTWGGTRSICQICEEVFEF